MLVFGIGPCAASDDLRAYGEYLAGECVTCHQVDGRDEGITSIVGWPPKKFKETLQLYRSGARDNPVMVSVASSLDEKQIAALATYFGSLTPDSEPKP